MIWKFRYGATLSPCAAPVKAEPTEDAVVLRQERMTGSFARNMVLPFRVDAEKASAKFDRGVVTLTLPRPEEDKPHRISISRA